MSQVVLIVGAIAEIVAIILTVAATITTAVKGNQSVDPTRKGALRAAAGFLGISILFALITLVSAFYLAAAGKCSKKKSKVLFIIALILLVICYIIFLVILRIYQVRAEQAGDSAGATSLRASFVLPIVALALHALAFILFFLVFGRRAKALQKYCRVAG